MAPLLPRYFLFRYCIAMCRKQFLQPGLQGNKYNNNDIEIFKPSNSQPCS